MKFIIKGGVWKNTEDEILKAAVSKYGKNQWARISSLLVRKTPKQCKARWYEWLDPSIKKTEWSKEEDEKLLHLAKLMPTQWRTIAPIVGRTPAQCLERYQRLLDEAEARESDRSAELGLTGAAGHETGPSADDVRKLRPGEVDPEPETKPARPDPVDMDEDEKEMLSEARARLANTQGKKAKRKARERQLEEARRLTALQKRRELKAAGIHMRMKQKKNVMDYNTDIPFEKKPALGFYDTTEEANRKVDPGKLTNVHLSKLNRRRADIEDEKNREKKRKAKQNQKNNAPQGNQGRFVAAKNAQKIVQMQEQEQIAKRRKLVLPAPQVGEQELEEIVKTGFAGETAKTLVLDNDVDATEGLVSDYSFTPAGRIATATRTPRAPPSNDHLLIEARNLKALSTAQTPLLGGENASLEGGTGFEGIAPKSQAIQTPNPLATPLRHPSATPFGKTPMDTPFRTPREEKLSHLQRKKTLLQGLASLPKPRNEWEIRLPDIESNASTATTTDANTSMAVEDMSDLEREQKEAEEKEAKERALRRSLPVQLNLPRPSTAVTDLTADEELDPVEKMIAEELQRLLKHDAVKYPVAGGKVAPGATRLPEDLEHLEDEFDSITLQEARQELDKDIRRHLGLDDKDDIKKAVWDHLSAHPHFEQQWNQQHCQLLFSAKYNRFMTEDEMDDEKDKIQGLSKMIEASRQTMVRDATKAGKLENKLDVRLGGYMARSKTLSQQLIDAFEEYEAAQVEYQSFVNLQIAEKAAIPRRVEALEEEVYKLASRERELQQKYKDLYDEKVALCT
ncbi:pre-mRNA splicing factor component-domain-containing protein [Mycotypha africana]|uniref:pre-mRNA splicing factor component-domain-containing protein n=1 Tax=Mycotypha africana TaxID=64632 RepID=UPI0023002DDA|nr:pre-mRNA splicing factor component-domain-containing protein [Mycotypha africana]KAI8977609.1 pre-mRNA splicing factor component-domain-containing protein [Mycotypha africana]